MKVAEEVRRRVASPLPGHYYSAASDDLNRVIGVLANVTHEYMLVTYGAIPEVEAMAADTIVAASPLFGRLVKQYPHIVHGPLRRDSQVWATAGATAYAPHRSSAPPEVSNFRPTSSEAIGKPTTGGLYTSSTLDNASDETMWTRYVTRFGGSLFPEPRVSHRLPISSDARVYEVPTAAAWIDLLAAHGFEREGLLYPDWGQIAVHYDAVHMCLAAVVATQGLIAVGKTGLRAAPLFWDVESTLWLHWVFARP